MNDWFGTAIAYALIGGIILIVISYAFSVIAPVIFNVISFFIKIYRLCIGLNDEQKNISFSAEFPATIEITYQDRNGVITERTVTVFNINNSDGNAYFKGRCHLRRKERTFKVSGIIGDVINKDTGEIGSFEDMFY